MRLSLDVAGGVSKNRANMPKIRLPANVGSGTDQKCRGTILFRLTDYGIGLTYYLDPYVPQIGTLDKCARSSSKLLGRNGLIPALVS
jgi:hypothetical protein